MRKLTLALAATALLAAAPAAATPPTYTVTGGKLDWTIANQYTAAATRPARGSATSTDTGRRPGRVQRHRTPATAPATLTGPTALRPRSVDATVAARRSTSSTRSATPSPRRRHLQRQGRRHGRAQGHGHVRPRTASPITLVDPLITLNGLTGTLHATGVTADRRAPAPTTAPRRSSRSTSPTPRSSLRADGVAHDHGHRPGQHDRHGARGLRPEARRAIGDDEPRRSALDATPARSSARRPATGTARSPAGPAGKDGRDRQDAKFSVDPPGEGAVRDQAPRCTCG